MCVCECLCIFVFVHVYACMCGVSISVCVYICVVCVHASMCVCVISARNRAISILYVCTEDHYVVKSREDIGLGILLILPITVLLNKYS